MYLSIDLKTMFGEDQSFFAGSAWIVISNWILKKKRNIFELDFYFSEQIDQQKIYGTINLSELQSCNINTCNTTISEGTLKAQYNKNPTRKLTEYTLLQSSYFMLNKSQLHFYSSQKSGLKYKFVLCGTARAPFHILFVFK